jgi:peptide deformylase
LRVWQEHCLVLPPTFTATVLRDAWIVVEYQDLQGNLHSTRLPGESARVAQHELDHDRVAF